MDISGFVRRRYRLPPSLRCRSGNHSNLTADAAAPDRLKMTTGLSGVSRLAAEVAKKKSGWM